MTDVCADGIIHCQLPSRGTVKLTQLLERIEAFFINQVDKLTRDHKNQVVKKSKSVKRAELIYP